MSERKDIKDPKKALDLDQNLELSLTPDFPAGVRSPRQPVVKA